MNNIFKIILILFFFTSLFSCGGGGGGSNDNTIAPKDHRINMKFVASGTSKTTLKAPSRTMRASASATPTVEAVLFNSMEIVAYQKSSGYQDDGGFARTGSTGWAMYTMLDHNATANLILRPNTTVDVAALGLNSGTNLTDKYFSTYKSFSMDFIEVAWGDPHAIVDGVLYGHNNTVATTLMQTIPEFSGYDSKEVVSRVEGMSNAVVNIDYINIIFARKDWFPNAAALAFKYTDEKGYELVFDSKAILNATQVDMITDLVNNGSSVKGRYNCIFIIPYDGPVVMTLKDGDNGGQLDPTKVLSMPVATVGMDLNYASLFNSDAKTEYASTGTFKGQFNFATPGWVPFGLTFSIAEGAPSTDEPEPEPTE